MRELLARLGHSEISPTRIVGELSPANQQIVSMARALSRDTRLLVLDEPSAVLDQEEVKNLFRVIRDLTEEGVAVVYISHRLEEIREIGDRITVLKDGRTVGTGLAVADTPTADLIKLMTGRSIEYVFPPRPETAPDRGEVVLDVQDLALAGVFTGVNLTVHAGEIVGLAGLVGAGRSEILETLYGARRASAGTVTVDGKRMRRGSVVAMVRAGVGLAPEERKSQGLFLDEAVFRNITMSSMSRFARLGFLNRREERRRSAELTASLDVRPDGVTRAVRTLSGGNQQKVVLARWLLRECRVLLLDEPTRGVDVGARIRALPAGPHAGRQRCRRRGRLQRDRGGARSRRPGPRRPRGRGRPRGHRHRTRRGHDPRPRHGRKGPRMSQDSARVEQAALETEQGGQPGPRPCCAPASDATRGWSSRCC